MGSVKGTADGEVNKNECPKPGGFASTDITNEDACLAASVSLGIPWLPAIDDASSPKGCFKRGLDSSVSSTTMSFNKHSTGNASSVAVRVCLTGVSGKECLARTLSLSPWLSAFPPLSAPSWYAIL
jgi:hypothetical protein